jgi:hypothetical protein
MTGYDRLFQVRPGYFLLDQVMSDKLILGHVASRYIKLGQDREL